MFDTNLVLEKHLEGSQIREGKVQICVGFRYGDEDQPILLIKSPGRSCAIDIKCFGKDQIKKLFSIFPVN